MVLLLFFLMPSSVIVKIRVDEITGRESTMAAIALPLSLSLMSLLSSPVES
jgi:hypothetical protein